MSRCTNLETLTILNPECEVAHIDPYTKKPATIVSNQYSTRFNGEVYSGIVRGYTGSTAEKLAEQFGYQFQSLGESIPVTGDMNGDGKMSVADAVLLIRFIGEDDTLNETQINTLLHSELDFNKDGLISLQDVQLLLKLLTAQSN
ncbi:MAG: dockerin type I repeat-containing protein [Oscillospiraceae bacterium]|nr:dockerin type I repeat-containing protein [Oscillospiraceae bacterium]